jgi:TolA-binding protein
MALPLRLWTDEDKRRCALWRAIYGLIKDRKWHAAEMRLNAYLDEFPHDRTAQYHLAHIQSLKVEL